MERYLSFESDFDIRNLTHNSRTIESTPKSHLPGMLAGLLFLVENGAEMPGWLLEERKRNSDTSPEWAQETSERTYVVLDLFYAYCAELRKALVVLDQTREAYLNSKMKQDCLPGSGLADVDFDDYAWTEVDFAESAA